MLAGAAEGGAALVVHGRRPHRQGRRFPGPARGDPAARQHPGRGRPRHGSSGRASRSRSPAATSWSCPRPTPTSWRCSSAADIDAVWTVEPWVSRLELEAGGRVFLEQPDAVTTVLVADRRGCCASSPNWREKFRAPHTRNSPAGSTPTRTEAQAAGAGRAHAETHREIAGRPGRRLPGSRLRFTDRVAPAQFSRLVAEAQERRVPAQRDSPRPALQRQAMTVARELAGRAARQAFAARASASVSAPAPHASTRSTGCRSTWARASLSAWSGPSGCGKSTLLNIIAGLEQADAGAGALGRRAGHRAGPRPHDDVSGAGALSLARRPAQRALRPRT